MSVDALLPRLDGVRRTGADRWIARCPAHGDRAPSLSIRELGDGRVLMHCFAGCAIEDLLASIELGMESLFPPRTIGDHVRRERSPYDAHSILLCVVADLEIGSVAADNIANGVALTDADRDRLRLAAIHLREAVELARG